MQEDLSNSLVIRKAQKSDVKDIASLILKLAEFEKLSHEVSANLQDYENTLFSNQPKAFVLIAEYKKQVCGLAIYFYSYSTFLGKHGIYLEDLFVLPELRSKGIGKKLLANLAQIAVQEGMGRLEWSVLDWNTKALDFYARLGAKPQSEWTVQRLNIAEMQALAAEV